MADTKMLEAKFLPKTTLNESQSLSTLEGYLRDSIGAIDTLMTKITQL